MLSLIVNYETLLFSKLAVFIAFIALSTEPLHLDSEINSNSYLHQFSL